MAIDTVQLKTDIEQSIANEMQAYTIELMPGVTVNYLPFAKAFSPAIMLAVQALIDGEYPPVP